MKMVFETAMLLRASFEPIFVDEAIFVAAKLYRNKSRSPALADSVMVICEGLDNVAEK